MLVGIGSTVEIPCIVSGTLSANGPYGDKTNTPCAGNPANLTRDNLGRFYEIAGLNGGGAGFAPFFANAAPNNNLVKAACGSSRINRMSGTDVTLNLTRDFIRFAATSPNLITSVPGSNTYSIAYAVWNNFINNVRYLTVPFDIVAPCGPATNIAAYRISPGQVQIDFNAAKVRIERSNDGINWDLVVNDYVGITYTDTIDPTAGVPLYRIFSICNLSGQDYISVAGYINVYNNRTGTAFRHYRIGK